MEEVAPDRLSLTVDGECFDVRYDEGQPGAYHFDWLTGPNPGYGFSTRTSSQTRLSRQSLVDGIVQFLAAVDPTTGYIE